MNSMGARWPNAHSQTLYLESSKGKGEASLKGTYLAFFPFPGQRLVFKYWCRDLSRPLQNQRLGTVCFLWNYSERAPYNWLGLKSLVGGVQSDAAVSRGRTWVAVCVLPVTNWWDMRQCTA